MTAIAEGPPQTSGSLRVGVLGPAQIAFFVISAAGPLVAMAGGIPIAMLFGNGAGLPALFVIVSVILIAFAAGYTAMARHVRNAGAFYAFAARGLGGHAGGATGMIALLSYNAIQIGLYGLFGAAAQGIAAPLIGTAMPWWGYALVALGIVAILGYRQVDLSARILGLLVAAEYLVVLVLAVAIVLAGGDAGLTAAPFAPATVMRGSPAIGLMLCFAAFVGFEATTIYGEEARDPERTVPRATYLSVILIGGFYTLSTWAIVNGAGVDRLMATLDAPAGPTDLLFALSTRYVGALLSDVMRLLFVTSAFASLLAFHNAIARYLFAMGRERLLPAALGRTHPRYRSPHRASLVQSGLALAGVGIAAGSGADPVLAVFTIPSAVATLGIIVLMAITSLAALRFLRTVGTSPAILLSTGVALAALVAIGGLATSRFDLLAGSASRTIALLPGLIVLAAAIGIVRAHALRTRDAAAFAALGHGGEG